MNEPPQKSISKLFPSEFCVYPLLLPLNNGACESVFTGSETPNMKRPLRLNRADVENSDSPVKLKMSG